MASARASAAEGVIPAEAAAAISEAPRRPFYVAPSAAATANSATPVIAIVAGLRAGVPPGLADHVHCGATSQGIVDTAAMLVAKRSLEPLLVAVPTGPHAPR